MADEQPAPAMLAEFAGPVRKIGAGLWLLAALICAVGTAIALTANDPGFGYLAAVAVLLGIGGLMRYAAARMQRGDGPELPVVGAAVFALFGAAVVVMGIVTVFDDPAGFFAIAFGLVFIGAGWLMRRLFATPAGQRAVAVGGFAAAIRTFDGRAGTRRQQTVIHVDADASAAEVAAARQAWLDDRLHARPDWRAGRIEAEAARGGGNLLFLGAGLWTVFALALGVAAWLWGDILVVAAPLAGAVAAALWIAGIVRRLRLRKYGASHLVLAATPLRLGGPLAATLETGIARPAMPPDGFRLRLQCVHRWEETVRSGSDRRTHHRREVLWQAEARVAGLLSARHPGLTVPVRFDLPPDQPAATLDGGSEGIAWELEVTAAMPGLDYAATFTLPVLADEATPTAR